MGSDSIVTLTHSDSIVRVTQQDSIVAYASLRGSKLQKRIPGVPLLTLVKTVVC